MSDDLHRRPLDHHVEPLFAGLGVEEDVPERPLGSSVVVRSAWIVLVAAGLVLWWLA
ncbi:MAG TPA: hypothetical protein VMT18_08310 [Planctomycetota bacterium]|nr:hypothetical protein [Planctomycetota bacterium]